MSDSKSIFLCLRGNWDTASDHSFSQSGQTTGNILIHIYLDCNHENRALIGQPDF